MVVKPSPMVPLSIGRGSSRVSYFRWLWTYRLQLCAISRRRQEKPFVRVHARGYDSNHIAYSSPQVFEGSLTFGDDVTRHAAYPRICAPSFSKEGVGRQSWLTRHASNSSGVGFLGQTATAINSPNQVIPKTRYSPRSGSGKKRSWQYSSCVTISSRRRS